jgi:hypothetical protein
MFYLILTLTYNIITVSIFENLIIFIESGSETVKNNKLMQKLKTGKIYGFGRANFFLGSRLSQRK